MTCCKQPLNDPLLFKKKQPFFKGLLNFYYLSTYKPFTIDARVIDLDSPSLVNVIV